MKFDEKGRRVPGSVCIREEGRGQATKISLVEVLEEQETNWNKELGSRKV